MDDWNDKYGRREGGGWGLRVRDTVGEGRIVSVE